MSLLVDVKAIPRKEPSEIAGVNLGEALVNLKNDPKDIPKTLPDVSTVKTFSQNLILTPQQVRHRPGKFATPTNSLHCPYQGLQHRTARGHHWYTDYPAHDTKTYTQKIRSIFSRGWIATQAGWGV